MLNSGTYLVTGASSGIGACITRQLLDAGCTVVATSRSEDKLREQYGSDAGCIIIPWDLSDTETIKDYAKAVNAKAGEINGLVHCAGMDRLSQVHMIKQKNLEETFSINTYAALLLVAQFSKKGMFTPEGASFVLISSLSAHEGATGNSVYASSKAALEGFVTASAPELADKNIRINSIAPGRIRTPMLDGYINNVSEEQAKQAEAEYPLGWGNPEDIADMVEFLFSNKSGWITGKNHIVDGGHLSRKC